MTLNEYREKFGAEFASNSKSPWFFALVEMLKSEHPLKKVKDKTDGEKLHGAPVFLNQVLGYDACLDNIVTVPDPPTPPRPTEPPNDYQESEIRIPEIQLPH